MHQISLNKGVSNPTVYGSLKVSSKHNVTSLKTQERQCNASANAEYQLTAHSNNCGTEVPKKHIYKKRQAHALTATAEIVSAEAACSANRSSSSGLLAAKLQCNEWMNVNYRSTKSEKSFSSSNQTSYFDHPALKSLISASKTKTYLKKRRPGIDLGRRTKVLGKFLQSIEEAEDSSAE